MSKESAYKYAALSAHIVVMVLIVAKHRGPITFVALALCALFVVLYLIERTKGMLANKDESRADELP